LKDLRELNLSNNNLHFLPSEIGSLTKLEKLVLGQAGQPGNQVFDLPASMANMQSLRELHMANNAFEEFPMVLTGMEKLTRVDMSNNQLKALPAELGMMRGLQNLNVTNNQLQDVPVELGQMAQLAEFNYAGNPLTPAMETKIMELLTGTYQAPKPEKVALKNPKKK
jgi:Leucine-rich repeat (LRR) protein